MLDISYTKNLIEAGCDEAGRGCLAGPVYAAAVILPRKFSHKELNDSKKLTEKKRMMLKEVIEKEALAFAVVAVDNHEIDDVNILNASFLAMTRAVKKLNVQPELLLIDGNRFRTDLEIPYECMIKGDGRFMSIAAASILAKTYRDIYMENLHEKFPVFNWNRNKGYPTKEHRQAIVDHGITDYHRRTFNFNPKTKLTSI